MKTVGIVGGSGYTGGELIRLIINHPKLDIKFIYSTQFYGNNICKIHKDLLGVTNLKFTNKVEKNIDILLLCAGHGNSLNFLKKNKFLNKTKIIDLSNDFRIKKNNEFDNYKFIYGLPELNREKIKEAKAVANPGCFATAIQLSLIPLAKQNLIEKSVHVNATTGSTGAGMKNTDTTHFSWRDNNISWYKAFSHQHLSEISQTLEELNQKSKVIFIPQRGSFTRGVFSTAYTEFTGDIKKVKNLFKEYYKDHPFTEISDEEISLKSVINTNKCHIHLYKHENILLITCVLDNLTKGASGQALQNLNLMMNWNENLGLELKASIY
jgi:N-acetyl-gamma-glutamyl-phosphate reductase